MLSGAELSLRQGPAVKVFNTYASVSGARIRLDFDLDVDAGPTPIPYPHPDCPFFLGLGHFRLFDATACRARTNSRERNKASSPILCQARSFDFGSQIEIFFVRARLPLGELVDPASSE